MRIIIDIPTKSPTPFLTDKTADSCLVFIAKYLCFSAKSKILLIYSLLNKCQHSIKFQVSK